MADEADVFISYKRSDRERISRIADALHQQGLTVWLDARLEAGESFDEEITRHLRAAKAVLVCWSKESVESQWVRAEATEGRETGKLVAVTLEPCRPYPPFNLIHMEDLSAWRGESDHPAFLRTLATLARKAGRTGVAASAEAAAGVAPARKRAPKALVISGATVALLVLAGGGYWSLKPTFRAGSAANQPVSTTSTTPADTTAPPPAPSTATAPTTTPASNAATTRREPFYLRSSWGVFFDPSGAPAERLIEQTRGEIGRDPDSLAYITIIYAAFESTDERRPKVDALRQMLLDLGWPASKIRTRRHDRFDMYSIEASRIATCANTGQYPPGEIANLRQAAGLTGCND